MRNNDNQNRNQHAPHQHQQADAMLEPVGRGQPTQWDDEDDDHNEGFGATENLQDAQVNLSL
jgi:hypothetical protein